MNENYVVAVIQARIGSSRLPNKAMLSLHGKPTIEWVVRRVKKARRIDQVVLAIPDTEADDVLEKTAGKLGVAVFRGAEKDVLHRLCSACEYHKASHFVRICADRPLICWQEIDHLVAFYFDSPCDYAFNHIPSGTGYPYGLGAEIVSFKLLREVHEMAVDPSHREHCFNYIIENKHRYTLKTFEPKNRQLQNSGHLRLDLDTFADYRKLCLKHFTIETPSTEVVKLYMNS